jgi:hypothetical protein
MKAIGGEAFSCRGHVNSYQVLGKETQPDFPVFAVESDIMSVSIAGIDTAHHSISLFGLNTADKQ